MINSGDGDKGVVTCPFSFYTEWLRDPETARKQVESFTRTTICTDEAPRDGIPNQSSLPA